MSGLGIIVWEESMIMKKRRNCCRLQSYATCLSIRKKIKINTMPPSLSLSAQCAVLCGCLSQVQDVPHFPLPILLLLGLWKGPQPVASYIFRTYCEGKDLAMLSVLPMNCWRSVVKDVSELDVGFAKSKTIPASPVNGGKKGQSISFIYITVSLIQ